MGGPPGPKAAGTHNGFQVGFQVDTTGNTTLCNPVAPPLWLPRVTPGELELRTHGLEGLAKNGKTAVFSESFKAVGAEVHFTRGNTA